VLFRSHYQTTDYEEFRADFFSKNKILDNAIIGTPKDCLEQILELKKQVPFTTLSLKLLSSKIEDSKNILKLYKEFVIPHL